MNLDFNVKDIFLAKDPIDFRAGINTLIHLISDSLGSDPYSESLYIFMNRHKDRIKCLYYDGTGFWMFYKVLNSGRFSWTAKDGDTVAISREQLDWLLSGLNVDSGAVFQKTYPIFA